MSDSLSVVLPVRNEQRRLHLRIERLLEILPELASRFEIVVVDDGSSDETEEVAREMARRFPQVCLVRHEKPRGMTAATQSGMEAARFDFVYCDPGPADIAQGELRRLWMLRHNPTIAPVPAPAPNRSRQRKLIERLLSWASQLEAQVDEAAICHQSRLVRRPALVGETTPESPRAETQRGDLSLLRTDLPHSATAKSTEKKATSSRPRILRT